MATRVAFRQITRRFSSGGKVLGEEEKAAENIYIKKMEQEKLEKLARKGPNGNPALTAAAGGSGGSVTDAKPSSSSSGGTSEKVSRDKNRNYAVLAGVVTVFGALGWYLKSGEKKEQVQD